MSIREAKPAQLFSFTEHRRKLLLAGASFVVYQPQTWFYTIKSQNPP